jgi:uncharacterized protein YqhQ
MPSSTNPDGELLVGGQALIEGVMMRSPGAYGIAVRRPDGSLAIERGKVAPIAKRYPFLKLPVLRGVAVLFQSLAVGIRALNYFLAISRMKDIHRVFQYHGAEHKVVFNHEAGLPLTVENARVQSRLHPRCGTSFLLFVLLVSIVVFALIPKEAHFAVKLGGRVLLVPVIAGLSYEVLRLTAKRRAAPVFAALVAPGLALQRITTQEPTDDMLEVAIVALEEALRADGLLPEIEPTDLPEAVARA